MPEVVTLRRQNASTSGRQVFVTCSWHRQAAWCDLRRHEPESETATHLAVSAATLALAGWLRSFHDDVEKARVLQIGKLTGLKEQGGRYFPANFERALLLREIIRRRQPKRVLELGTGRGLGILAMADQVQALGYVAELVSVDIIAPAAKQNWPLCFDGQNSSEARSVEEIWNKHFPELCARVTLRTGATTAVLPALLKEGRKFDFIFVDAGHDVYSVFHDFAYSCLLLAENGEILMDDFAPTEPYGLGTCIVAAHATKVFEQVEVIETNGLVFEDAYLGFTRGMVHLAGIKRATLELDSVSLLAARILGKAMEGLFNPKLLPIRLDRLTKTEPADVFGRRQDHK
jgi:predicted O-methyltransferase YrrM